MEAILSMSSRAESQAEELVAVETLELSTNVRSNNASNEHQTAPCTAAASSEQSADAPNGAVEEDIARRELDAVAGLLELRTVIRVHNINGERTSGPSTSSDASNKTAFNEDSSHEASSNIRGSNEASAIGNLSTASALAEDCDALPGPSTSLNGNGNGIAKSDDSDSSQKPSVLLRANGIQCRSIVENGDQLEGSSTLTSANGNGIAVADHSDPLEGPSTLLNTPYQGLRNGHLTQTIENLRARLERRQVPAVHPNYNSDFRDSSEASESEIIPFGLRGGHQSVANEAQVPDGSFDYAENWLNRVASRSANYLHHIQEWTENKENNSPEWIPIGTGHTMIPASVYRHINWESYTAATRTLLMEVFSRNVLATHSLTGRASNAFPSKPAKAQLDVRKVKDIVQEVVRRCDVAANLVRTCITTKCADESKMYRTRQQNQHNKRRK